MHLGNIADLTVYTDWLETTIYFVFKYTGCNATLDAVYGALNDLRFQDVKLEIRAEFPLWSSHLEHLSFFRGQAAFISDTHLNHREEEV